MNLFTKIKLRNLKKTLKFRNAYRSHFGNFLSISDKYIIKILNNKRTTFEKQVIDYLINYYKYKLKLDFNIEYNFIGNKTAVISPIVNLSFWLYLIPKMYRKILYNNTKKILNEFSNKKECILAKLKENNTIIDKFEIFCADLKPSNFFIHEGKIYLLDLEDFYFIMYDKNGKMISKDKLKKEDKKLIINYQDRLRLSNKSPRKEKIPNAEFGYILTI